MFDPKPWLKEKMNFFRLMSVSQKAWLAVRDSLLAIKVSEANVWMIKILNDLIDWVSAWKSMAESMESHKKFFSSSEIEIVRSAEISGNIVTTLQDLYEQLEDSNKMMAKIKKALMYPIILMVFASVAIVILLTQVVPVMVDMFPSQDQLPGITVFVLSASDFFKEYWFVIVWTIVWVVVWFKFLYANSLWFKKFIDSFLLKVPVVKDAVMTFYIYRFSVLLWQFYKAWLTPVVSLGLIGNIFDNYMYKIKVMRIKQDISKWFSFFESMEWSDLFDPILVQILHVWEETGTTGETMSNISWYYKDNLSMRIDAVMSLLEPVLIAWVAVIIGVIMASIFLPMASLIEVIG